MRGTTSTGMVYDRRGSGPVVVLLHGWCLNGRLWSYEEERLVAEGYDVIVPDLPGFGRADALDGPYTLDRYAGEVNALLAKVGARQATVVGFAFGALVALAAAGVGSRIGAVVPIGVPAGSRFTYEKMPGAMRRDWPEFARRSARAICKAEHSEATFDWLGRMFEATPLHVAIAVNDDILAVTEPEDLAAEVDVPALFIHGEQDDVVPVEVSEVAAARIDGARVEVVPDCGHLATLDQKDAVHAHIVEMLGAPRLN